VIALMAGRTFVIPEDIKEISLQALSHRIVLTYEALANDMTTDDVIKKITDTLVVV
jgi:MoxR-like ATPase